MLCLLAFIAGQTDAQLQWYPLGTTITYTWISEVDMPYSSGPSPWMVTDTLTIKGKLCQKFEGGGGLDRSFYEMYVYEDTGVLYWFRPKLDTFTILYDFNKDVGDSWSILGVEGWRTDRKDSIGCELIAQITAKGTDTINGFPLRTIEIKITGSGYGYGFAGTVIEYLGHTSTPRPDPYGACAPHVSESSDFNGLRCFDHPQIGYYNFLAPEKCDSVTTAIREVQQPIVTLNPNPGMGIYQLDYTQTGQEKTQLNIYDLTGRVLAQQELNNGLNTIDISFYTPGVYPYRLLQNGTVVYYGKLLKQ